MRIDSHQHFWKYDPVDYGWINNSMSILKKNHVPETLIPIIKSAGINGTVAVQARQTLEETRWLLQLADEYDFIKGVVGWVDLRSESVREQLDEFASHPKFVGVRHVVQDEPDDNFVLLPEFQRGIAVLEEFGLTYDILIFPRQLKAAIELVKKFPNQSFVLDHIAKPPIKEASLEPWQELIRDLASNSNVFCKVSGMVTEANWESWEPGDFRPYLDVVFDAFGIERVMFGSDWPVCTLAGDYDKVKEIISGYCHWFSEKDANAIFGENAARFYGLSTKMTSMDAVTFQNPGEVKIVQIPGPEMGTEDVLIDIHYVGLCGSDLSTYRGLMPMIDYPRIPGHEISGTVIEKGADVPDSVQIGDRVMLSPYTHCGSCPACLVGRVNTCQFNETLGVQRDGALTKLIAISYQKVFSSNLLDFKELALVEPLSVGYHAANRGQVSEIDTVLVLGCGAIGMGVIAACARKGATVIAADIDDEKLQLAKELGATYVINSSRENLQKKSNLLTLDKGVNVAIEAAGLPELFRLAVDVVSFGGRVVYVGYTKQEVTYDTKLIVRKELSIYGSRNALHVFPSVIKMLEKQERPFKKLVSKIFPFDQTAEALKIWDENPGEITKILIDVHN